MEKEKNFEKMREIEMKFKKINKNHCKFNMF